MFRKSLQFENAVFEQNLVKQRGYKMKKRKASRGLQDLCQCDLRGRKIRSYFRNEERGWWGLYVGIVDKFYTKWNVCQSNRASQDHRANLDSTCSNSQRFLKVLSREVTLSDCVYLKEDTGSLEELSLQSRIKETGM